MFIICPKIPEISVIMQKANFPNKRNVLKDSQKFPTPSAILRYPPPPPPPLFGIMGSLFQSERNHCYENDLDLHENETACRTHFHLEGFALGLVLKQGHKRTRKWPAGLFIKSILKSLVILAM